MLKDLEKNITEASTDLANKLATVAPFFFPKRFRRIRWADTLPPKMVTKLQAVTERPEDMQKEFQFSALGWGVAHYNSNTGKNLFKKDGTVEIDGITYTEYMPAQVRDWFGITELKALKIQALNLNNAPLSKVAKQIKGT